MTRRIYERYTRKANRYIIKRGIVRIVLLSDGLKSFSLQSRLCCDGKRLKTRYLFFRILRYRNNIVSTIEEEILALNKSIDRYRGNDVFLKLYKLLKVRNVSEERVFRAIFPALGHNTRRNFNLLSLSGL